MRTPSSLSRRRALSLLGGGLCVGAVGGYVVRDTLGRNAEAAPLVITPSDWSHPNYDATNNRHPPKANAPDDPHVLDVVWTASIPLKQGYFPDLPEPVTTNGLVVASESTVNPDGVQFDFLTTRNGTSSQRFSKVGPEHVVVATSSRLFSHYDGTDGMQLDAWSLSGGEKLWSWSENMSSHPPLQPVVAGGLVHVATPTSHSTSMAYGFTPDGKVEWKTRFGGSTLTLVPPAATARTLVHPKSDGFTVFDTQTGEYRWETDWTDSTHWSGSSRTISAAPVIYDELLYTSAHGRVAVYDLEEKRDPRWVNEQGDSRSVRIAAVDENHVYLTQFGGALTALHADDGTIDWTLGFRDLHPAATGQTAATLCDGKLYVGVYAEEDDHQPRLAIVDAESGEIDKRTTLPAVPKSGPILSNGTVVLRTREGFVGLR
ncbi:membrane biogenesis protein [Haloferax mediterranei ATCC 33500]|nr:PQQ-binding-like beta-propeller repeat protein [Haloferax mediterranei]AHZ23180.1 membrane biogenesis protein [Haloferax mediterranei ATCC 33500]ELZ99758.1 outer membrane biogenesis protein BamB [Haloferax mediterranei ATCC 33500]MDX5987459.1 PQQ-binding-like beta-propeller repeat protein [Haloferax mediterranei ATCC 33500]QCQ73960.1 membrane biogenesis protein [Haloferax mediterranei ATCC 33500]